MNAKLDELYERIQKLPIDDSASQTDNLCGVLDILCELVDEMRRIESANIAAFKNLNRS